MKTAIVALGLGATLLTVAPTLVLATETDTTVGAFKALTNVSSPVQLEDKELAAIEGGAEGTSYDFTQTQPVAVIIENTNININTNIATAIANAVGGTTIILIMPININVMSPLPVL